MTTRPTTCFLKYIQINQKSICVISTATCRERVNVTATCVAYDNLATLSVDQTAFMHSEAIIANEISFIFGLIQVLLSSTHCPWTSWKWWNIWFSHFSNWINHLKVKLLHSYTAMRNIVCNLKLKHQENFHENAQAPLSKSKPTHGNT